MTQIIKGYIRVYCFDLDMVNLVYTDLYDNEKFIKVSKDVWSALFEMYS